MDEIFKYTKTCTRCKLDKPLSEFGYNKNNRSSRCYECLKEITRSNQHKYRLKYLPGLDNNSTNLNKNRMQAI